MRMTNTHFDDVVTELYKAGRDVKHADGLLLQNAALALNEETTHETLVLIDQLLSLMGMTGKLPFERTEFLRLMLLGVMRGGAWIEDVATH
ncbi:MAG: hypothetical protein QM817_42020 [Archangium sp.]